MVLFHSAICSTALAVLLVWVDIELHFKSVFAFQYLVIMAPCQNVGQRPTFWEGQIQFPYMTLYNLSKPTFGQKYFVGSNNSSKFATAK